MLLNLKDLHYYFLTTISQPKREHHIKTILSNYNITKVLAGQSTDKYRSGTVGWGKMLDKGMRDQDPDLPFQPFMVLEDDISITNGKFPDTITVPDYSDIVYTGISPWGLVPGDCDGTPHSIVASDTYIPGIVRIYNMLSTHGILFTSPAGVGAFQRSMVEANIWGGPWDIIPAKLQPFYNVYAMCKPLVYQDPEYNGDACTNFELTQYCSPPNDWTLDTMTLAMSTHQPTL